jgi:DNA-binding response OmpR family regulator
MTQLDPRRLKGTPLLRDEEILVLVQKGLKNRRVLPAVREGLMSLTTTLGMSRRLDDQPIIPRLIVLVGGWDSLSVIEAVRACRTRFAARPTVAVLVGNHGDIAELFAAGVSDCVRWPVARAELAARVRARLSTAAEPAPDIALDPRHRTIRCNDVRATLSPKEFRIASQLVQNSGQWISSQQLLNAALGETRIDTTRVRFHVFGIRKKLRNEAWRLRSHRTLGYRLETS